GKSVIRASWGIYNPQQNMLTEVGAITTNGVQQQTLFAGDVSSGFISPNGPPPVWPGVITPPALPPGTFPFQPGVTVFNKNYRNPRIYAANFGYTQQLAPNWAGYLDLTWAKGVYLTRFVDPNNGSLDPTFNCGVTAKNVGGVCVPNNGDTVSYPGPS